MAGSVNKVILIGNLGADPEIRRTQDGRPIANLRIATSETWRDRNSGERKEKTEWHTVVIFNEGLCKVAEQYLKKGSTVYVEGQLQTRKWQDQNGQDRYSTEVVLQGFNSTLTMLDELKWSEAVYGLGAGIFFLGYFFFEVPSNLLLQKIGAKKTIMRITIGWGLTSIATMFVKTPEMFYALRFLLGVFEAGFYPGIILYLTYWFPGTRRAKAFGMFMSASAFAGVIGGPLAGTIMTGMHGVNGWSGWQWVLLLEGIPAVLPRDNPTHLGFDQLIQIAGSLGGDQAADSACSLTRKIGQ